MTLATAEELRSRQQRHERGRARVAAIGFAPLLLLYLMVHTKYLRPLLPEDKTAQVGVLIGLPALWFGCVIGLYRWLGPRAHGLQCPGCGAAMLGKALGAALATGQCSRCHAPVVAAGAPPAPSL
jgi:hypothetical protein